MFKDDLDTELKPIKKLINNKKKKNTANKNNNTTKESNDIINELDNNNIIQCKKYLENPTEYLNKYNTKPQNCSDTEYLQTPFKYVCEKCKMKKISDKSKRDRYINNSSMPLCVNDKCCIIEDNDTTFGCPHFCFETNVKNKKSYSETELKYLFKKYC